jgi:hypothetical protein
MRYSGATSAWLLTNCAPIKNPRGFSPTGIFALQNFEPRVAMRKA